MSFDVFVQAFDDGVAGVAVTEADALPDLRADGQVVPTGKDLPGAIRAACDLPSPTSAEIHRLFGD